MNNNLLILLYWSSTRVKIDLNLFVCIQNNNIVLPLFFFHVKKLMIASWLSQNKAGLTAELFYFSLISVSCKNKNDQTNVLNNKCKSNF